MKIKITITLLLLLCLPALAVPPNLPEQPQHEERVIEPIVHGKGYAQCTLGVANGYACNSIDMLAHVPIEDMGGSSSVSGSDGWGWKDEQTGKYYAIVALSNGTSFIDITTPTDPIYVGQIASNGGEKPWRDVKTYQNYAYIVADGLTQHGMQVFDLTRLRDAELGSVFAPDSVYTGVGSSHNIAINEDSGFAYIVGANDCEGGLHMVNLAQPASPVFAGCFSDDGYTHDVQCINYSGPDVRFLTREICFASNVSGITIVDVTDKQNPVQLNKGTYPNNAYTHQGWLGKNQRYFYVGDELDELNFGFNAKTLVFDLQLLDAPVYKGAYNSTTPVIDHNLYVVGDFIYQTNYEAGFRILQINDPAVASLSEVAFFDTFPAGDTRNFRGAWSVYPFFDNETVLVFDINAGLFILQHQTQQHTGNTLNGSISGQWVADGLPDQGLTIMVDENEAGPFLFYVWYVYLNGQPYWLAGNAFFQPGDDSVVMPAIFLDGLEFLTPTTDLANRTNAGTVTVTTHTCGEIHVQFDFGTMGSGEIEMTKLLGIQGRGCVDQDPNAHEDHPN